MKDNNFVLLMDGGNVLFENEKNNIISNNIYYDLFGNKSLTELDCNETNVENIISECKTMSFGADKKTVILNNFNKIISTKNILEEFIKYLEKPVKDVVHILLSKEIYDEAKSTKVIKSFLKILKDNNAEIKLFKKTTDRSLKSWIVQTFNKEGYHIDNDAVSLFIEFTGNNIEMIKTELEKLMIFKIEDKTITVNDIEEIIQNVRMDLIFAMIDAIVAKDILNFLKINGILKYEQNYPILHILLLLDNLETIYYCKSNKIFSSAQILKDKNIKIYNPGRAYFLEQKLRTVQDIKIIKKLIKNIKRFDILQKMYYFTNLDILMEELLF